MRGPEPHTTDFLKQFSSLRTSAQDCDRKGQLTPLLVIAVVVGILIPPLGILLLVLWGVWKVSGARKHKERTGRSWSIRLGKRRDAEEDPVFHASTTFATNEDGEVWMSREKQLAQLEVFRRAGLLEDEEYRLKKERIENSE